MLGNLVVYILFVFWTVPLLLGTLSLFLLVLVGLSVIVFISLGYRYSHLKQAQKISLLQTADNCHWSINKKPKYDHLHCFLRFVIYLPGVRHTFPSRATYSSDRKLELSIVIVSTICTEIIYKINLRGGKKDFWYHWDPCFYPWGSFISSELLPLPPQFHESEHFLLA